MPVDSGAKNCDTDGQDQSFKTWSPEPGAHLAMRKFGVAALLVVASALSACEFAGSALAPSITGRAPGAAANAGISVQPPAPQPLPQGPEPQPAPQSAPPAGPAGAGLATGRPFVVIPFHDPAVQYEQQLYEAVNAALERSPNVAFDLVAVTPAAATPDEAALNSKAAQTNADRVMRSLLDMGLPADRISLTQMTDPNVQRNEVHLYVR